MDGAVALRLDVHVSSQRCHIGIPHVRFTKVTTTVAEYKMFEFLQQLVVSYTTFSPLPEGGIFSAALSMKDKSLTLLIMEHLVLRCPDFPL